MSTDPEELLPKTGAIGSRRSRVVKWLLVLLLFWGAAAYLAVPWISKRYFEHETGRHRLTADEMPRLTRTADDHPGDPINLALVGSEADLIQGMAAAGWLPADPITFESSIRIAVDSVFRRPDDKAPVSNLFLFGRKQDLAFEQPIGHSPRQRHHVRFWRRDLSGDDPPQWFGSATRDERVGLSHATGQITHHIGPEIDAERDRIISGLQAKGRVRELRWEDDFHDPKEGRNGGGDRWRTDGRLAIGILQPGPGAEPAR